MRWLSTLRGGVAGVLGLVTAVFGVLFVVRPDLRPPSRDKVSASLEVLAVEPRVPLIEWARRQFGDGAEEKLRKLLDAERLTADERKFPGTVAYVRLQADGFKNRDVSLRARIYNAQSRRPATDIDLPLQQVNGGISSIPIDAPSRTSVQLLFITDLHGIGPVKTFIRAELYDDEGMIAVADSPTLVDGIIPHR
jgi:hypothetical protein